MKRQGIQFAQVVNSLILKIQDMGKFTHNFQILSLKLNVSAQSVTHMKVSQIS